MSASPPQPMPLESCARELGDTTEFVFTGIEAIAAGARSAWASIEAGGRTLRREDVTALKPLAAEFLRTHRNATGAGLIIEPGMLSDATRSLEWWQADTARNLSPLELEMNPDSGRYYDYTSFPWFRVPRDSGRRTAFGPYVDYHGADRYILTFTTPIQLSGRFVGVAGSDIAVADFEAEVWPSLRRLNGTAALVNQERRVIASTSPEYGTGTRIKRLPPDSAKVALRLPDLEWSLVRLPS